MPIPERSKEIVQEVTPEEIPAVPVVTQPEPTEASSIKYVKPIPKLGIKVVALRNGIWKKCRMNPGDEFYVETIEKVGDWMRCIDASLEKQHLIVAKERKQLAGK